MIDINDFGQIVGYYVNATTTFPFMYINGTIYDLDDFILPGSEVSNISPVAINNLGQIAANTDEGAILLIPMSNNTNAFP